MKPNQNSLSSETLLSNFQVNLQKALILQDQQQGSERFRDGKGNIILQVHPISSLNQDLSYHQCNAKHIHYCDQGTNTNTLLRLHIQVLLFFNLYSVPISTHTKLALKI